MFGSFAYKRTTLIANSSSSSSSSSSSREDESGEQMNDLVMMGFSRLGYADMPTTRVDRHWSVKCMTFHGTVIIT